MLGHILLHTIKPTVGICMLSQQHSKHVKKGATPISLSEANTSTPGAVDSILGHNNDILLWHDDTLLDKERTTESILITVE